MAKSVDIEIQKYLPLLGTEEKKSILGVIKSFLSIRKETAFDIEQYNKDIDQSLAEVKDGKYINQDDLEKEITKW